MSKLFAITESDLGDLERLIPEMCDQLQSLLALQAAGENGVRRDLNVTFRRVKGILSDVRWDYMPHRHVEVLTDQTEGAEGEA